MGKQWKVFLNEGPFSPHVLAGAVARTCRCGSKYLWVQMQCTAMAVAVHCGEGCSALQGRLHCTVSWTDLSIPKCINRYWGNDPQWSENLKVMYRLTDYME